jgi:hypothetical protein
MAIYTQAWATVKNEGPAALTAIPQAQIMVAQSMIAVVTQPAEQEAHRTQAVTSCIFSHLMT